MSKLSQKDKFILENHDGVVLLQGTTSYGDIYYAYIKADKLNIEKMFRDHEEGKTVDLFDYGEVIEFGKGEPTQESRRRILEQYSNNGW